MPSELTAFELSKLDLLDKNNRSLPPCFQEVTVAPKRLMRCQQLLPIVRDPVMDRPAKGFGQACFNLLDLGGSTLIRSVFILASHVCAQFSTIGLTDSVVRVTIFPLFSTGIMIDR